MSYQLDMSGRIEYTSTKTVLALANTFSSTVSINSTEKRKLIAIMKKLDRPKKTYIYKIFAALLFLLIKDAHISYLVIDKEYTGQETKIIDTLQYLYRNIQQEMPKIIFDFIGKRSNAHLLGINTYRRNQKPGKTISAEELLGILYTKKRLEGSLR